MMTAKEYDSDSTLITFPCDFVIKVFGNNSPEFEISVLTIVRQHVPDLKEGALVTRKSETGKYQALTITVHVESKSQLDAIYQDLSSSSQVLMAL